MRRACPEATRTGLIKVEFPRSPWRWDGSNKWVGHGGTTDLLPRETRKRRDLRGRTHVIDENQSKDMAIPRGVPSCFFVNARIDRSALSWTCGAPGLEQEPREVHADQGQFWTTSVDWHSTERGPLTIALRYTCLPFSPFPCVSSFYVEWGHITYSNAR